MNLPRGDRQYGHTTLTGLPEGVTPQVKVGSNAWTDMELGQDARWRILLRGPEYIGDTDGVPVATSCDVFVRAVDDPETASVPAGRIYLVEP